MINIFFISMCLFISDITLAQNVGIGTLTPAAKLDIIGNIKITDGTQGTGKVLTCDATGKGSWQAAVSSSSDPIGVNEVVWVGCNAWMTKNLNVNTYRNGDPIPKVTNNATWAGLTSGAYCYYQNDSATYAVVYGKLYNWYAVNDPRGLAPEGWHIPCDFEWTTLVNTLGGNAVAGGPMKAIGTTNWNAPNLGATNLCSFAAMPGGQRNANGNFSTEGNFANWWSSTKTASNLAYSRNVNYNDTQVNGIGSDFHIGYSVRCVKD